MVLHRDSNGLAMRIKWFGNALRMVLQRGSNGFATQIEWFCNADRIVWQCTSNGFATQIEWFCNADRTPLQHIEWFGNADRILPHPKRICARIVKVQSISRMRTVCYNLVSLLPLHYSNDVDREDKWSAKKKRGVTNVKKTR